MGFLHGLLVYAVLPLLVLNTVLYALSYALPSTLAGGHPRRLSAFFGRALAYILSMIFCASYGITASLVLRAVGYGGLAQWTTARCFKWVQYLCCGVWFEVEDPGQELKTRPAVLVGPHQTELDILMLGAVFPPYTSVTSKASLKWMPFLGQFMWASKTVFIDRANPKLARSAFDGAAKEMLKSRQNVWIFAEGTRSYSTTPMLLPFKKGAFHLAIQAQVPIIPVACENYAHILVMKGGWKKWRFEPGIVRVKVLKKTETKGLDATAVDGLIKDVRDRMLAAIEEMGRERAAGSAPIAHKANGKAQ